MSKAVLKAQLVSQLLGHGHLSRDEAQLVGEISFLLADHALDLVANALEKVPPHLAHLVHQIAPQLIVGRIEATLPRIFAEIEAGGDSTRGEIVLDARS